MPFIFDSSLCCLCMQLEYNMRLIRLASVAHNIKMSKHPQKNKKYLKIKKGKSEQSQTKIHENRQNLTIQPVNPDFWIKILIERKKILKNINFLCRSVQKTNSISPKYIVLFWFCLCIFVVFPQNIVPQHQAKPRRWPFWGICVFCVVAFLSFFLNILSPGIRRSLGGGLFGGIWVIFLCFLSFFLKILYPGIRRSPSGGLFGGFVFFVYLLSLFLKILSKVILKWNQNDTKMKLKCYYNDL